MKNNIYIFTNGVSRKNGASSSILDLANNFIKLNYDVSMITPFGFLDKFIYKATNVSNKLNIKILHKDIFKTLEKKPTQKKILLNKVLNLFESFNKDIGNSIVIDAIGLSFEYLKEIRLNGSKVIFNHAGSPNAYIKYFGMDGDKRDDLVQAQIDYLNMINQYDYILFQSQTQADTLNKLLNNDIDKTLVLTPGVTEDDISKIIFKPKLLDNNKFNITIVGSVQQRKGQHLVLDIAKNIIQTIPNARFHIVGNMVDNNYYENIKNNILKENLENIVYIYGFKTNYLEYMNSSDIIIQLSEEEGVSRILREAMILGKPIVSFALDGTNDLLENGQDSLLTSYGDIDKIIENLKLLYNDKGLYEKLSKNIKINFDNKYSSKQYLKKLEKKIKEVEEAI